MYVEAQPDAVTPAGWAGTIVNDVVKLARYNTGRSVTSREVFSALSLHKEKLTALSTTKKQRGRD